VGFTQSNPFRFSKMLAGLDGESSTGSPDSLSSSLAPGGLVLDADESSALSSLKDLIASAEQSLDSILTTITEAAQRLTGASGSALAMWKDGAMICRARSGAIAPALGTELSSKNGISGESLRTGTSQQCADTENDSQVDIEVCRSTGLRSVAVFPIHGWRGVNGIVAVFSARPANFTEKHVALLQELAAIAERARASRPQGASPPERRMSIEKRI
jgi:GAF domain-containing protein